ncbi:hypothetical protein M0802_016725 [Mischocyttarus mexicanus]|nr:hypothetical protein M0802_016725 [Mischocyttarus mexicanus]
MVAAGSSSSSSSSKISMHQGLFERFGKGWVKDISWLGVLASTVRKEGRTEGRRVINGDVTSGRNSGTNMRNKSAVIVSLGDGGSSGRDSGTTLSEKKGKRNREREVVTLRWTRQRRRNILRK